MREKDGTMYWFVDGEAVTPEQMRSMADAIPDPQYDHQHIDGCRAELVVAGHSVIGSKYGWRIQYEPMSYA